MMKSSNDYDWPFFSDRHRKLKKEIDTWAQRQVGPLLDQQQTIDEQCRMLVRALGQSGFLQHAVIAPWGGASSHLDVRSLCLIRESLAFVHGLADFSFAIQGLGSAPISLFGSDSQKKSYLPAVARGESIGAFALSEPDAGSDVAALACEARFDGQTYVLDGEKTWVSNGGIADWYIVFARSETLPGTRGLSAFIVPADSPGLKIVERLEVMAPHPLARLRFEQCRVDPAQRLGEGGDGFRIAMETLDIFRASVGAAALGLAKRALTEALARANERYIGGSALIEHQMTQARIADMATAIDAASLLVYRAAWCKDTGARRVSREAAMAKLFATEQAQLVIDSAVQIWGGLGVKCGSVVEQLYREIRALRIYEGASEVQKLIIARQTNKDFLG